MGIIHRVDIFIWVSKADWVHFGLMTSNCILRRSCVGCVSVFVEVFSRDSFLLLFCRSCYMDDLFFMNNIPLKGYVSIFPSCFIGNSLTPLLLSSHPRHSSFRYVIHKVLSI